MTWCKKGCNQDATMASPQVMLPILLCWPMTSEMNVGGTEVEFECLLIIYGDETVDVSTMRQWVVIFSSGYSSCGTNFYGCGMQALVHCWQKCVSISSGC